MASKFEDRKSEYEGILSYAARRFEVPGILEAADLYQEGCMVLHDVVSKGYDGDDLRKLFKTMLFHKLTNKVWETKAQCRDWRKRDNAMVLSASEESEDGEFHSVSVWETFDSGVSTPLEECERREAAERADAFLSTLMERLSDEQQILLFELLYPQDLPEDVASEYERVPTKNSVAILQRFLGWSEKKVRYNLKKIRHEAAFVALELRMGDFSEMVRA